MAVFQEQIVSDRVVNPRLSLLNWDDQSRTEKNFRNYERYEALTGMDLGAYLSLFAKPPRKSDFQEVDFGKYTVVLGEGSEPKKMFPMEEDAIYNEGLLNFYLCYPVEEELRPLAVLGTNLMKGYSAVGKNILIRQIQGIPDISRKDKAPLSQTLLAPQLYWSYALVGLACDFTLRAGISQTTVTPKDYLEWSVVKLDFRYYLTYDLTALDMGFLPTHWDEVIDLEFTLGGYPQYYCTDRFFYRIGFRDPERPIRFNPEAERHGVLMPDFDFGLMEKRHQMAVRLREERIRRAKERVYKPNFHGDTLGRP